ALGASSLQIVWSSLAESVLLAFVGGALGIFLAKVSLGLFRHHYPIDLPRLGEVHLNITVLLFALVVTLASSILFGTLPALRLVGIQPQAALQQNNSHTLGSRQGRQLRTWVMALHVSGCTALLLITGLFAKSLLQLLGQDKGFQTAHVVIAEARLSTKLYGGADSRTSFIDTVLNNLRSIPGVKSAGFVSAMPLEGETWIEDLSRVDKPTQQTLINLRWVSSGYFETMGERLLFGRFFEDRDRNLTNAVISQGLAKTLWPNEDPIGQQLQVEGRKFNVIGVVADSRSTSLKTQPAKMAYLHYKDRPPYVTLFTVRGAQPASQLLAAVQQAIWQYAPNISIARVKTLDSQVSDSLATERFQTSVLIAFAVAALLLAMLGMYGVLSVSVAGRTREIGVRMALGATRGQMYSLTLSQVGVPVLGGLAAGLACGAVAIRIVHSLLYEVKVLDAPVSTMVMVLLLTAAFTAAFLPARRAASVDPMEALRIE
ncbi:MAG TPA: FtsX-like permease family protein, partial [Terriglobales bacterium]|nr:FtsX-like permease family protein [Terriglobales bacterium]